MIAHASNPITDLTGDQVRAVYLDQVDDWSELGAGQGRIFVVNKAEGRATLEVFLGHFGLTNSDIQADAVVGDNAQGVRMVASNPRAIGYVSIGEALNAVERGESLKLLALEGVVPSMETVGNGRFPLRRTLYLLFPGKADALGRKILDYLRAPEGRKVIEEHGFVPVSAQS
jgi:phosphate transport system substrate-binding protein